MRSHLLFALLLLGCPAEPTLPFDASIPFDASFPFDASVPPPLPLTCLGRQDAGLVSLLAGPDAGRALEAFGGSATMGFTVCLESGQSFRIEVPPRTAMAVQVSGQYGDPHTWARVERGAHVLVSRSLRDELRGWFVTGAAGASILLTRAPDAGLLDLVDFNSGYSSFGESGFRDWSFDGGLDPRQPTSDPLAAPVADLDSSEERTFFYAPLEQLGDEATCEPAPLETRYFRFNLDGGDWTYSDLSLNNWTPHEVLVVGSDGGLLSRGAIGRTSNQHRFTLAGPEVVALGFREPDAGLVSSCDFDGGAQPAILGTAQRYCIVWRQ